ncbi:UDP-N-acetylgalactosamine-undecaprenyl-phosphate N-acetylgalactosaminephosphotransferase [bacterium HR21]|nr:UDP-N-acetylgalactosamine-undecaprenyl-phosphate N-acetylgalactosaminephosphotransferase [bacterium HR21]
MGAVVKQTQRERSQQQQDTMRFFPRYPASKLVLVFGDYAAVVSGYGIAVAVLAYGFGRPDAWGLLRQWEPWLAFAGFGLVWLLILQHHGLYKQHIFRSRSRHTVLLLRSAFYALIGFALIAFFLRPPHWLDSRLITGTTFIAAFLLLSCWRLGLFPQLHRQLLRSERLRRRTAIAGTGTLAHYVAERLLLDGEHDHQLVGFLSDSLPVGTPVLNGYRVLGSWHHPTAQTAELEHIIYAEPMLSPEDLLQSASSWVRHGATTSVVAELYPTLIPERMVEDIAGLRFLSFSGVETRQLLLLFKRATDLLLAALALVVLAPLFALIALAIWLDSPGPIVHRQQRIGRHGKRFWMYKFRTMEHGAPVYQEWEESIRERIHAGKPLYKVVPQHRITRVGRWLRRWSLDELPQLWNVLRGEMSLVGPRPLLPEEATYFPECQQWRHQIPPGCTGLWQISDRSHTFVQMLLLDIYYVQNVSPWLDLYIVLKTIPYILRGQNR